jgi:galactonate dehydratase
MQYSGDSSVRAPMKIVDFETYLVGNPWKNWVFVRLITDEGITGIGEGSLGHFSKTVETAIHEIKPFVLGLNVFQTELLVQKLTRVCYADGGQIKMCAISAMEIACWDAIGKALGQPVYNLLGGACRESIPAYANGWYRVERTPEKFAEAARTAIGMGFRALKFDPFGPGLNVLTPQEEDLSIAIIAAVREAAGPHVLLSIDAHSRFNISNAIRIGQRIEPFNLAWYEEPVPHGNIDAIAEVARRVNVPVATGESYFSKHQLAELLRHNAIGIINFEPLHMGGMLGSRKAADMVDAHYGLVIPHAAQGPVCTLACLHIDAATPNAWVQETFEAFNDPWERDLVTYFPEVKDGSFALPPGPGLGADLNLDEVRRHPYTERVDISLFDEGWQLRRSHAANDAG